MLIFNSIAKLEAPLGFPALRKALTPDDHVVIVADDHLPRQEEMLSVIVEYLIESRIQPAAITIVYPSTEESGSEAKVPNHPGIRIEVHDSSNRKKLSYLATTRKGRRLYLNRTAFGGMYRVNEKGEFNVPFGGGNRTPKILWEGKLLEIAATALYGARLLNAVITPPSPRTRTRAAAPNATCLEEPGRRGIAYGGPHRSGPCVAPFLPRSGDTASRVVGAPGGRTSSSPA